MAEIHKPEYFVVKRSIRYVPCSSCKGTGTRKRTFRKHTYVENCGTCKGSKKERKVYSEEVPLIEALKELSIIK